MSCWSTGRTWAVGRGWFESEEDVAGGRWCGGGGGCWGKVVVVGGMVRRVGAAMARRSFSMRLASSSCASGLSMVLVEHDFV